MNWRDLKPGDHVRVTFEAPVSWVHNVSITLTLDPADDETETRFTDTEADAAKWTLLDPPLRVGRAKYKHNPETCDVLAILDGKAWVRFHEQGYYHTEDVEFLINIDEEPQP